MSGLTLFLNDAKDYELTHQLILNTLLKNNDFRNILLKVDDPNIKVHWEYKRGLFDLALVENNDDVDKPVCCIEIKMWSGLSDNQRNRQRDFIKRKNAKGVHILLGTSGFEYIKTNTYDQLSELTNGFSEKIGYDELINSLSNYLSMLDKTSDYHELINSYLNVLRSQQKDLHEACYNKNKVYIGHYYYSIFKRIQANLVGLNTRIYTVNNRAGSTFILNDQGSWFNINYKGQRFELYQEIINNMHEMRLYAYPESTLGVKKELASIIRSQIQQSKLKGQSYSYAGKASKYMILARKELSFDNPDELKFETDLFMQTHDILVEISKSIKRINN